MNIDRGRVVARFCRRFRRRMKVRISGLITADKFYRIDARLTGNGHDDGGDNEPNSLEHKYPPFDTLAEGAPVEFLKKLQVH